MSDAGHRIVKYKCGEHVESQCRCMMQDKPVIIGTTPCPTCQNPPTAMGLMDDHPSEWPTPALTLAARVAMVLEIRSVDPMQNLMLAKVHRILNGRSHEEL